MRRAILSIFVTCAVLVVGGASTLQASAGETRRDGGDQGPYVVPSPTLGKPAKRFVGGCELYLFGRFVEPATHPDYGLEKGYLIEKTDTDVLVNGVLYFSLLTPPEPEAQASERAERLARIYFETVRQLRKRVTRDDSGVVFDDNRYDFGVTITFEPRGLGTVVPVTFRASSMLLNIDGTLVSTGYKDREPVTEAELARIDSVRLDKVYSILSRKLQPRRLVLAGKIYINSYPMTKKEALLKALSKLAEVAEIEFVKPTGEPYYKPMKIDGFDFFSPEIADFVGAKGGDRR